jgi:hypothetical protein
MGIALLLLNKLNISFWCYVSTMLAFSTQIWSVMSCVGNVIMAGNQQRNRISIFFTYSR